MGGSWLGEGEGGRCGIPGGWEEDCMLKLVSYPRIIRRFPNFALCSCSVLMTVTTQELCGCGEGEGSNQVFIYSGTYWG